MDGQVEAAVWGALVGTTLGAPFQGKSVTRRPMFYEPVPQRMAPCADLDAWCVYAKRLSISSRPSDIADWLTTSWQSNDDAAAYARANQALGFGSPASGSWANPLGQSCTALLRSAFWGIAFLGNPSSAAWWADFDCAWDHSGNARSLAAALASCVAQIQPSDQPTNLVRRIMERLPVDSPTHAPLKTVLSKVGSTTAVHDAVAASLSSCTDPYDATVALCVVLASLLNSSDTPTALGHAASCGGPAVVAAGVTGLIASQLWGVPEDWQAVLGDTYVATTTLREVDPPETISNFIDQIKRCQQLFRLPVALEGETEIPPELPKAPLAPQDGLVLLAESDSVSVHFEYLDGPLLGTGKTSQCAIALHNLQPWEQDITLGIDTPPGLTVATRASTTRLQAGGQVQHGMLVRPTALDHDTTLRLSALDVHLSVPFLKGQSWFVAGPFADEDGQAFTRTFPPERQQKRHDPFAGRSGLAVRWEETVFPGRVFDVEPLFQFGPGVVILYAKFRSPQLGRMKLLASGAPGVVVTVNGQRIVGYHDQHTPAPRPIAPYIGEYEATETTTVLIKLIRGKIPAAPLTLGFFDRSGNVIDPIDFNQMDE